VAIAPPDGLNFTKTDRKVLFYKYSYNLNIQQ
jgi:hypothetical protein